MLLLIFSSPSSSFWLVSTTKRHTQNARNWGDEQRTSVKSHNSTHTKCLSSIFVLHNNSNIIINISAWEILSWFKGEKLLLCVWMWRLKSFTLAQSDYNLLFILVYKTTISRWENLFDKHTQSGRERNADVWNLCEGRKWMSSEWEEKLIKTMLMPIICFILTWNYHKGFVWRWTWFFPLMANEID
jgi:hypothetical protein